MISERYGEYSLWPTISTNVEVEDKLFKEHLEWRFRFADHVIVETETLESEFEEILLQWNGIITGNNAISPLSAIDIWTIYMDYYSSNLFDSQKLFVI